MFAKVGVGAANGVVGLLPAFAYSRFSSTGLATGILFAARGLGAFLGPVLTRRVHGANPTTRAIVIVCGISTLSFCVFYAVFPFVPVFGVAVVIVIFAHLGGGAQWTASTFGLQRETPDYIRGRVMALDYGLATLSIGISALAAGALADAFGAATATWWLAGAGGVYGVLWLGWSLAAARR